MKKWLLCFFFMAGFVSLHANAETSPFPKNAHVSKAYGKHHPASYTDFDYDIAEIENCVVINCSFPKTNQGSQRSPENYLSSQPNAVYLVSCFSSRNECLIVELFGNNYLSYNYPSHNLW